MKINEICKPTILPDGAEACVVPMKKMSADDWKKEEEQWKQADIEDEKFYRMKGHAERDARRHKAPVKEGSGIRYDNMGRPYFDRYEDYLKAVNSDTGFIRKAAQDVMARGGQEGWPATDVWQGEALPWGNWSPFVFNFDNNGDFVIPNVNLNTPGLEGLDVYLEGFNIPNPVNPATFTNSNGLQVTFA